MSNLSWNFFSVCSNTKSSLLSYPIVDLNASFSKHFLWLASGDRYWFKIFQYKYKNNYFVRSIFWILLKISFIKGTSQRFFFSVSFTWYGSPKWERKTLRKINKHDFIQWLPPLCCVKASLRLSRSRLRKTEQAVSFPSPAAVFLYFIGDDHLVSV